MILIHRLSSILALAAGLPATLPAHAQPAVEWSTVYGPSGDFANAYASAITVDPGGNIWVAGSTDGSFGGPFSGGRTDLVAS